MIVLFFIGSALMRSAGCIINDIWDRDFDKQVERTKTRPLASGTLSLKQALYFLATLLLLSFIILLQFKQTAIMLGILCLPLIALYPLMKRLTYLPQIMLGITFNISVLIGYSAITGTIHTPALLLYIAAITWTIGYDTIYAHQDKYDDAIIGVKLTALKFGKQSKIWVSIFYGATILSLTLTKGITETSPYILFPAIHMAWQIKNWKLDNPENCLKVFKSNIITGILILLFLIH